VKIATFVFDSERNRYLPANGNAMAITAIVSKRFPRREDMIVIRSYGYEPRLTNGELIAKVDIRA
jgi:hypothetical protein